MKHRHPPPFLSGVNRRALGIISALAALLILALIAQLALMHHALAQEGEDWGDAPEPPYSTTMAFNGAHHLILPGFSLGPTVDSDPDGQPTLPADGDDVLDGSDDEDGITFQSALIPGLQTCIDATLTNTAGVQGAFLDGWIDFNANGMWEPHEHLWNNTSQPLLAGSNILCFDIPAGASRGQTYARFRLSDGGGMMPDGPGPAGEVEDYQVYIEFTKWDQPPTKKNPEDECYWGWDEVSIYGDGVEGNPGFPIVADDWECRDERPITDIHWWGSYEGWYDQEFPPGPPPPQYQPTQFHIGIWTDVPANPPDDPFSHPLELIWDSIVNLSDVNEKAAGCDNYTTMQSPDTCFYYEYKIPPEEWFIQNPGDHIYWLSISAIYPGNEPPQQYLWGWKTRKPEWNDDAVRIFIPDAPKLNDPYIDGEPIETQEEGSWDTSFVLTSLPTEPRAPILSIAITNTVNAKLSWPHVQTDIAGNPITVNRYYIYRDTSPYQAPTATQLLTIDGPFTPGDVIHIDSSAVGNASQNYYYYVRAAVTDNYGGDILSAFSNHVGEFDFTLVPGS